jgi:D-alanine-D-alanine ligase
MKQKENQKRVAVLFGGRSAEHEISIITALQAITALDTLRYHITPVYIDPNGRWYTGAALLDKAFYKKLPEALSQLELVTLLPDPTIEGLYRLNHKQTSIKDAVIPIDIYFLAFHGQHGEDGCIQGLLEMANATYTGSNVSASAVAMNKYLCKQFLLSHGIPCLPAAVVKRKNVPQSIQELKRFIESHDALNQFPLFVKPCHLGSSIGISIANNLQELHAALAKALRYDDEALIEPCVTQMMEINVSILDGTPPTASVVELPVASNQMLTYEDKYLRGRKKMGAESTGMASLTRVIDPQDLDPALKKQVTNYALNAFQLLDCCGVVRFDFMVDLARQRLYFNELNPVPGSLSFYLWEKSNPPILYTEILDRIILRAEKKTQSKLALQQNLGFKAL